LNEDVIKYGNSGKPLQSMSFPPDVAKVCPYEFRMFTDAGMRILIPTHGISPNVFSPLVRLLFAYGYADQDPDTDSEKNAYVCQY